MRAPSPALVYNLCLLIGLLVIGAGVWLHYGVSVALMVVGALVVVLTLYGAERFQRRSSN